MIKGSAPGAHILTSRLFLKRFQPPAQQATEDDRETQSLVNALAGCPAQTAVESDIKVNVFIGCCKSRGLALLSFLPGEAEQADSAVAAYVERCIVHCVLRGMVWDVAAGQAGLLGAGRGQPQCRELEAEAQAVAQGQGEVRQGRAHRAVQGHRGHAGQAGR